MQFAVEHLGLAARDPAALHSWYVDTLGGQPLFQCENPGKSPTFFVRLPGGPILEIYPAVHDRGETSDNSLAGWRHLALRVESLDAARRELSAGGGVRFSEPVKPAGGGGHVLFFQDPEGNLLHLVERPAESSLRLNP